jgi:magnesium transporter
MLYLSKLLGTSVEDSQNVRLGKIIDVLLKPEDVGSSAAAYPSALLVEGEENPPWQVPPVAVEWQDDLLRIRIPTTELTRRTAAEQDVCLAQEVLDKQVIDIERKKTVRVNDVCFANDWQIMGIDNSNLGLIRRIAPGWLLGKGRNTPANLIPWERVELISSQQQEQPETMGTVETAARTPSRLLGGHLADLHPADIAQIVHQLTPGQGARLLEGLDNKIAADTMEEIDTDLQRDILANLKPERAATILQEMEPDEIADLLARLPEERSQELLRLMNPEESEDVQELLEYESDTAGGLMTIDYVAIHQNKTVAEALELVRSNIQGNDIRLPYIYCVADETQDEYQLLGVVSLWDLLVAVPTQNLEVLMQTDVITVNPDRDGREVAEIMAKYNLLAIPVVNTEGILVGVVTIDDAIDVLLPNERRRRPGSMY